VPLEKDFGKGTTSVVPLNCYDPSRASAPEASFLMVENEVPRNQLSFDDFAAAQAASADAHALPLSVYLGMNRTQIDVPAPLRDVVRVADMVSRLRLLPADFTFLCHDRSRMSSDIVGQTSSLQDEREFRQMGRA
jgi:hypothetical protein